MSVHPTTDRTGKRFLGNKNTKEVHDLNNEQKQCQIDEIFRAGHAVRFIPDTLVEAKKCGYDNGHYCIGGSTR